MCGFRAPSRFCAAQRHALGHDGDVAQHDREIVRRQTPDEHGSGQIVAEQRREGEVERALARAGRARHGKAACPDVQQHLRARDLPERYAAQTEAAVRAVGHRHVRRALPQRERERPGELAAVADAGGERIVILRHEGAPFFGGRLGVCTPADERLTSVQPADARRAERGHRLREDGREQHERQQPRVHEQAQRQHGDPRRALRCELAAAQAHAHDAERHERDVPQAVDRADDGRGRAGRDAAAVHVQHLKRLAARGRGRYGRVEEADH